MAAEEGRWARLHAFSPSSRANGPGCRAVLWLQGCTLACPGCFNLDSHARDAGTRESVDDLVARILDLAPTIEGITLSGGEPWQQPAACRRLVEAVRASSNLTVVTFTGFGFTDLERIAGARWLRENVDVAIAGPYDVARRAARGLIGSSNKSIHFLGGRYGPSDFTAVPVAEVVIEPDGRVVSTGIDPIFFS